MKKLKAFTYLEVIVVVAIFVSTFALGTMSLTYFLSSNVNNAVEDKLISELRLARNYSEMRVQDSSWGVHFYDNPSGIDNFTMFKGDSYVTRDNSFDEVYEFPPNLNYSSISLNGGGSEIVFSRMNGETMNYGDVTMLNDSGKTLNINVNQYGQIIPS